MKKEWKTIIGAGALVAVLLIISLIQYNGRPSDYQVISEDKKTDIFHQSNVDKLLDEMELGAVVFNVPSKINIDDSPQIQLILSLADSIETLKKLITEEGKKIGATIKISNRMEARLTGYKFQISAITPEIQAVSKHRQTEWKWEIHPKEEGTNKLHLTVTALLDIDGHSTPRAIRTFDKDIEVQVTNRQKILLFFQNNWQWLWAAILLPVTGWLLKRRKNNKSH